MAGIPGFWRITKILERLFPVEIQGGKRPHFVTIDDYDGDLRLKLDVSSYMGRCIYWQSYYGREELIVLDRLLRPDMTFVDIGANNDYFTIYAAKRLPKGKVLSFEPVPDTFSNLEHNVRLNGFDNVVLFQLGLSDQQNASIQIYSSTDDNRDGLASVFPGKTRNDPIATIKLERLDAILDTEGISKVDVIKIDIEGGELFALKGAENTLKRDSPDLMIEFNAETYQSAGYSIRELAEYLSAFGYSFYAIGKRGTLRETPWSEMPNFVNVLCSKKPIEELT
jgi:FkbM family methyltransferase